jgi:hypothetical protein
MHKIKVAHYRSFTRQQQQIGLHSGTMVARNAAEATSTFMSDRQLIGAMNYLAQAPNKRNSEQLKSHEQNTRSNKLGRSDLLARRQSRSMQKLFQAWQGNYSRGNLLAMRNK